MVGFKRTSGEANSTSHLLLQRFLVAVLWPSWPPPHLARIQKLVRKIIRHKRLHTIYLFLLLFMYYRSSDRTEFLFAGED